MDAHETMEQELKQPEADDWIAPMAAPAYYGITGRFVGLVAPETEASQEALLTSFLVVSGVLFGRNAFCIADCATHYPAEYLIHIGDSGRSRKGTATRHTLKLANRAEMNFQQCVKTGLSTGEGLIRMLQDGQKLNETRHLGLMPEFGSLLTVAKREGNIISSTLRSIWDSDPLAVTTKTDSLKVSDYFMSVLGHITSEELLNGLASIDLVNGMANRFLFCKVRRSKFLPEGGADVNLNPVAGDLHLSIKESANRGRVSRDPEAKELWGDVYQKLANQPKGLKGSLCSRAESHVLRLSLIYALLDGAEYIRVAHLRAALAVWDYCEDSIAHIFQGRLGDTEAEKILASFVTGPRTMSEISATLGRNKSAEWINAKLTAMEKAGLIVRTTKTGDRKTVAAWDKK